MEAIKLKYKYLFQMLDLDFNGYKALIEIRDKEIEEWKNKNKKYTTLNYENLGSKS